MIFPSKPGNKHKCENLETQQVMACKTKKKYLRLCFIPRSEIKFRLQISVEGVQLK